MAVRTVGVLGENLGELDFDQNDWSKSKMDSNSGKIELNWGGGTIYWLVHCVLHNCMYSHFAQSAFNYFSKVEDFIKVNLK